MLSESYQISVGVKELVDDQDEDMWGGEIGRRQAKQKNEMMESIDGQAE